jgi:preprotein translocase subunit SecA
MLEKYGIRFQRLDAVNKDNENGIKETAGLLGSVTVATNMAGRGIDIKLGPGAAEAGGLYVIGSSKNTNVRIDNQLRGRAARQGDPGRTKYFMSLDDEIVRTKYGPKKFDGLKKAYAGSTERITNKVILSMVQKCQSTLESQNKQTRRQLEEKEAKVFTKHKKIIYDQRREILTSNDEELEKILMDMINSYVDSLFDRDMKEEEIDAKLSHLIDTKTCYSKDKNEYRKNLKQSLTNRFNSIKITTKDKNKYLSITRKKMLKVVNEYWISHMETLDRNWRNALYYAYSNADPMELYERQSIIDLQALTYYIQNEMITYALDPQMTFGKYEIKEVNIDEGKEMILV